MNDMTTWGAPSFKGRQTKKPARASEERSETKVSVVQHDAQTEPRGPSQASEDNLKCCQVVQRGKSVSLWVHW